MKSNELIKQAIMIYLDSGMTDKTEIYSAVVGKLGVPRPTVRRCARELRDDMERKVKILEDLNSAGKPKSLIDRCVMSNFEKTIEK